MDYSFKQGEDKKISLEVLNTAGAQVDMSVALKIKANFRVGGTVQKIFSITPASNEGTMEVDGVNNYQLNLFVERIDSINFPTGVITIDVIATFTDAEFPDNDRAEEFNFSVGSVKEGKTTDIVL